MNIGQRIKLARTKAKLSMKELAQMVGVSTTSISKFERDITNPRQTTLLRLAKALSVGIEYFFREIKVDTLSPTYRKHAKLGKREQEKLEATIIEIMERYLTAEQLLRENTSAEIRLPRFQIKTIEEAEQAANQLREIWKLGFDPLEDLCGRLENNGVKVIKIDGPRGFDGFSCWANGIVPVIAFNTNVPGDRQRFNITHELGHLVLELQELTAIENAVHRFAAAFLVPAEAAFSELGSKRSNLSFKELLILKEKYGLSIQAWIRRAADLGIINDMTYSHLFRQLSAWGWRTKEPGNVSNEEPRHLQLLVYQAVAEKLITPSYAETLLGKPAVQGLPKAENIKLTEPSDDLAFLYATDPELTAFTNADLGAYNEENQ
ncbi:MAG: helix-turn-helix domain-containing protein [Dethiobacter sp.]|jgi:Zn-dependent peptidase ImmA (M78 family)/DNA-binding XRE family transcriptional regulator|nr:MAG: helix-turn-helix domain-containing protein [Dethiobacter sp.]